MSLRTTVTTLAAAATLALAGAPAALAHPSHAARHSRTSVSWNAGSGERVVLLHVVHHRDVKHRR